MSRILLFILMVLPFGLLAQQGVTYGAGVVNISLGAGFPNATHSGISATTSLLEIDGGETGKSTPFFMTSVGYGITETIDIGVYGGYFKSDSEIVSAANLLGQLFGGANTSYGSAKYSVFSLGGKLVYHRQLFPAFPKLDLYASTYLGWNFVKDEIDISVTDQVIETGLGNVNVNDAITLLVKEVNYPRISYEVNVGGKYAISSNWNIYLEAGYGRYLVNAGLTYSIPSKAK